MSFDFIAYNFFYLCNTVIFHTCFKIAIYIFYLQLDLVLCLCKSCKIQLCHCGRSNVRVIYFYCIRSNRLFNINQREIFLHTGDYFVIINRFYIDYSITGLNNIFLVITNNIKINVL